MELWTNDTLSEFGIKLNSELVLKTGQTANLTKMIDESFYKDGYNQEWHYTLSQWVIFYFANKYLTQKDFGQKELLTAQNDKPDSNDSSEAFGTFRKRAKPGLKCHFCNLKYCLEEERVDHEQFWPNDKLSKILSH